MSIAMHMLVRPGIKRDQGEVSIPALQAGQLRLCDRVEAMVF